MFRRGSFSSLLLCLLLLLLRAPQATPRRAGKRQKRQKPQTQHKRGGAWPRFLPKLQWRKVQNVLDSARDTVGQAASRLDDFLFGEPCPFVEHPARAVRAALSDRMRAQPHAARTVVGHIKGWYGTDKPLVLAFTGPTGVGKTEMAHVLAEAVLAKRTRVGRRGRTEPKGLLVFRGEDFAVNGGPRLLARYHTQIKTQLAELLRICDNRAVVVFDEVQKIVPGTLEVLLEAMSERPRLTVFSGYGGRNGGGRGGNAGDGMNGAGGGSGGGGGKTEVFDTSKVIFVLISDIGKDEMFELILDNDGRENTPPHVIENKIRSVLQAQWDRLAFTQAIDGSVPFLPLEEEHIREVLELKLTELNQRGQTYKYWAELQWDVHLVERLSGRNFIKYTRLASGLEVDEEEEEDGDGDGDDDDEEDEEEEKKSEEVGGGGEDKTRIFAKYGARGVVTDGPVQKIRELLAVHVPKDPSAIVRVVASGTTNVRVDRCTFQAPERLEGEDGSSPGEGACKDEQCPLTCSVEWEGPLAGLQA